MTLGYLLDLKCQRVTCSLHRQKARRERESKMEYFKSSLKSVLGTAGNGQPTGADTVSDNR